MFSTNFVLSSDPDITTTYTHTPIPWNNGEALSEWYQHMRTEIADNCKESDWGWCDITVTVNWLGLSASKTINCRTFPNEKAFIASHWFKDLQKDCCSKIEQTAIDVSKRVAKHFTAQFIDVACDRQIHLLLKSWYHFGR